MRIPVKVNPSVIERAVGVAKKLPALLRNEGGRNLLEDVKSVYGYDNQKPGEPRFHDPISYTPPETPERDENFANWFKQSKAVGPDGKPLMLVHNTPSSYNEFDTLMSEGGSHFGVPAAANSFMNLDGPGEMGKKIADTLNRGKRSIPVHLSIQNPIRLKDFGSFSPYDIAGQLKELGHVDSSFVEGINKLGSVAGRIAHSTVHDKLRALGHDGIVYLNRREGLSPDMGQQKVPRDIDHMTDEEVKARFPHAADSWIAFKPNQIKSAIGNNGDYSTRNDPTLASGGGVDLPSRKKRDIGGGLDQGKPYDTAQDGPFYRVSRSGSGQASGETGSGHGQVWPVSPVAPGGAGQAGGGTSALPPQEANLPLKVANEHNARNGLAPVRDIPMPPSSLQKQSAIGKAYDLAAARHPEYERAVYEAYARHHPELINATGAKNYDELRHAAYHQMAKETDAQFHALPLKYSFYRGDEGAYPSSKYMLHDLHNNKHLFVYQGGDKHEFLHNVDPHTGLNENEKFRAVHDAFGHGILGNPFGAQGEERAWGVHSQMYSPLAKLAMSAETRGQNSFVNYTPINAKLMAHVHEIEKKLADTRPAWREQTPEQKEREQELLADKKLAMSSWQYAPQSAALLPPEMIRHDYDGGMPDYIQNLIKPPEGVGMSAKGTHYGNTPGLTELDPKKFGSNKGIVSPEVGRLGKKEPVKGAVRDRVYFYLGDNPQSEQGVGHNKYGADLHDLYDMDKDPLGIAKLAREHARHSYLGNFNPGLVDSAQAANDTERMAKEHGFKGVARPGEAYPMAAVFEPTKVRAGYKKGGRVARGDGGGANKSRSRLDKGLMSTGLFDLSGLAETPKVSQFDLPRYVPKRGPPERITDLVNNKDVREKLIKIILAGKQSGGMEWYNTEPLLHAFVKELGNEHGPKSYRKYLDFVAATSPRSRVGENARNASYYYTRLYNSLAMPIIGSKNPKPYGHIAQKLHQQNAGRLVDDTWDYNKNPKPASFVENLSGNYMPATVDAHAYKSPVMLSGDPRFLATSYKTGKGQPPINPRSMVEKGLLSMEGAAREPTYWEGAPSKNEYDALEKYYKGIGAELGMRPAQAQASSWIGGAQMTGMESGSHPFMAHFDDRLARTARAHNQEPKDTLSMMIRGQQTLLARGGKATRAMRLARDTGGSADGLSQLMQQMRQRQMEGEQQLASARPHAPQTRNNGLQDLSQAEGMRTPVSPGAPAQDPSQLAGGANFGQTISDLASIGDTAKSGVKAVKGAVAGQQPQGQTQPQGSQQPTAANGGATSGGPAPGANGVGKIDSRYSTPLGDPGNNGGPSAKEHYDFLVKNGATSNEALMLTGGGANESGLDPTAVHDNGNGYGMYGHNLGRLDLRGKDWQTQAVGALKDLRVQPNVKAMVDSAKTPEDLARAEVAYERPQGWTPDNPAGAHNYTGRLNTLKYLAPLAGADAPGDPSAAVAGPGAPSTGAIPAGPTPSSAPSDGGSTWQSEAARVGITPAQISTFSPSERAQFQQLADIKNGQQGASGKVGAGQDALDATSQNYQTDVPASANPFAKGGRIHRDIGGGLYDPNSPVYTQNIGQIGLSPAAGKYLTPGSISMPSITPQGVTYGSFQQIPVAQGQVGGGGSPTYPSHPVPTSNPFSAPAPAPNAPAATSPASTDPTLTPAPNDHAEKGIGAASSAPYNPYPGGDVSPAGQWLGQLTGEFNPVTDPSTLPFDPNTQVRPASFDTSVADTASQPPTSTVSPPVPVTSSPLPGSADDITQPQPAGQYSAPKVTLQAPPLVGAGTPLGGGSSGSGGFQDAYGQSYATQAAADAGQDKTQDSSDNSSGSSGGSDGSSGSSGGGGGDNSRGGYIKSKTNRNVEHALKLVSSNKKSSPKKKNDINRALNIARSAGRR